jgi:group I intron endonuclease
LKDYFNIYHLEKEIKKNKSMIYRAILKYGYSGFTLEILEYCQPTEAVSREQYYLDLLKPEYNILKTAGSSLGFKHSDETIAKIRAYTLTSEQKAKQLEHLEKLHSSEDHRERISKFIELRSQRVEGAHLRWAPLDTITDQITVYSSIREAARAIEVTQAGISVAFNRLPPCPRTGLRVEG